jgi:hypothetical protein
MLNNPSLNQAAFSRMAPIMGMQLIVISQLWALLHNPENAMTRKRRLIWLAIAEYILTIIAVVTFALF